MLTELAVKNMRFHTHIGCLEDEKERTSELECEVVLSLAVLFSGDASHDDLANTLDYREIEATLLEVAGRRHYNMMESLGEAYLLELREKWPQVRSARITLKKPGALQSGAVPQVTMVSPDDI